LGFFAVGSAYGRERSEWSTTTPESHGLVPDKLDAIWNKLRELERDAYENN